jgi:hypothetical protein
MTWSPQLTRTVRDSELQTITLGSRPSSSANVTMLPKRVRLAANASLMTPRPPPGGCLLTPITDRTEYAPARMLRHVKPDRNPRRNQGVRVRKQ